MELKEQSHQKPTAADKILAKNQTIKNEMKKSTEIKEKIVHSRYLNLLIFLLAAIYLYLFGEFYIESIAITAVLFFLIIMSNELINTENIGGIAIAHMLIIVLMIGAYDYFSQSGDRIGSFLNFLLPIAAILFCYGFYLNRYIKRRNQ